MTIMGSGGRYQNGRRLGHRLWIQKTNHEEEGASVWPVAVGALDGRANAHDYGHHFMLQFEISSWRVSCKQWRWFNDHRSQGIWQRDAERRCNLLVCEQWSCIGSVWLFECQTNGGYLWVSALLRTDGMQWRYELHLSTMGCPYQQHVICFSVLYSEKTYNMHIQMSLNPVANHVLLLKKTFQAFTTSISYCII